MSAELTTQLLEKVFTNIHLTRMAGVPVINERLSVKAVDFQPWHDYSLGVLITPWFMNLIIVASEESEQRPAKVGSIATYSFPSGAYDFVTGFEDGIGHYQSCSLFSPMFEFEDQIAAELTAREALVALLDIENFDREAQLRNEQIEEFWQKDEDTADHSEFKTDTPNPTANFSSDDEMPTLSERAKEPSSRRDFLRGKIFQRADKP